MVKMYSFWVSTIRINYSEINTYMAVESTIITRSEILLGLIIKENQSNMGITTLYKSSRIQYCNNLIIACLRNEKVWIWTKYFLHRELCNNYLSGGKRKLISAKNPTVQTVIAMKAGCQTQNWWPWFLLHIKIEIIYLPSFGRFALVI